MSDIIFGTYIMPTEQISNKTDMTMSLRHSRWRGCSDQIERDIYFFQRFRRKHSQKSPDFKKLLKNFGRIFF